MKITNKLIFDNVNQSVNELNYLNLSNRGISSIDNLENCVNLKHLILRNNDLNSLLGLEKCRQLWRLEFNNNKIKNLDGLTKFVALGTLNLHANEFNWIEFEKIRHLHIIDLITSNNPKLDKDENYRIHVIDCLPNVWMIDGLLVTTAERNEVTSFFEESALTQRPIRNKLSKYQFIPSDSKKRDVFGDWSTLLGSKFAVNEPKNIDLDLRRLDFIASWFEEIILVELREQLETSNKYKLDFKNGFLKELLQFRRNNTEMCNMILVLLTASLEFDIPLEFLIETLNFTHLSQINESFESRKLFELPRFCRIYISNLLLSAVKIDRDQNNEAGFYENLFLSLRNILNEQFRDLNSCKATILSEDEETTKSRQNNSILKDNRSLLSTEIIQLFCIVPSFYEHLIKSEGLVAVLNLSIGDPRLYKAVQVLLDDCQRQNKTKSQISEELGNFITSLLKLNVRQLMNKKSKRKKSSISFLTPNESISNDASNNLTSAHHNNSANNTASLQISSTSIKPTTSRDQISNSNTGGVNNNDHDLFGKNFSYPVIGQCVIIDKRKVGRIIRIDTNDLVHVKFDYRYDEYKDFFSSEKTISIDLTGFEWDVVKNFWKPIKSVGDINTLVVNSEIRNYFKPCQSLDFNGIGALNNSLNLDFETSLNNHNHVNSRFTSASKTYLDEPENTININMLELNLEKFDFMRNSHDNMAHDSNRTKVPSTVLLELNTDSTNIILSRQTSQQHYNQHQQSTLPIIQPILYDCQNHHQSPLSSPKPNNGFYPSKLTHNNNRPKTAVIRSNSSKLTNSRVSTSSKQPTANSEFMKKWNDDDNMESHRASNTTTTTTTNGGMNLGKESLQDDNFTNTAASVIEENKNFNVTLTPLMNGAEFKQDEKANKNEVIEVTINEGKREEENKSSTSVVKEEEEAIETELQKISKNEPPTTLLRSSTCVHCNTATVAERIPSPSSPPPAPTLANSNSRQSTPYYNHTVNRHFIYKSPNQSSSSSKAPRQFIKLQDCTTWLTITDTNPVGRLGSSTNGYINKPTVASNTASSFKYYSPASASNSNQVDVNLNRITMLLNRRSSRVNTYPKMPQLNSPSSKAHMMCKGLRPNTFKEFGLVSKKLEIGHGRLNS